MRRLLGSGFILSGGKDLDFSAPIVTLSLTSSVLSFYKSISKSK